MKNPQVPCPPKTSHSPLTKDTTGTQEQMFYHHGQQKRVTHHNPLKEENDSQLPVSPRVSTMDTLTIKTQCMSGITEK